mgnify:CR=1 FL=1|tara:strand:- start:2102 stop:3946 length:1845 start_codon:yes stop_codon:yes gene_type:complete
MNRLLSELLRRNVLRVAAAYLIVGWLIMQVVSVMTPALNLPDWVDGFFAVLLIAGFPLALLLAWAFELTPEGVRLTSAADAGEVPPRALINTDFAIIGLLVLVLGVAGYQILTRGPANVVQTDATPATPPIHAAPIIADASIAVLPFADLSQAGDQQYFSDGISEEILNVLVRVQGLDVASRTSAFQFRGDTMGIPEIAGRLGVRHVLEGSVRKDGETIRITAQLIDATDDRHLWSQTYDRPFTAGALFAVQDEIANAIVTALRDVLDMAEAPAIEVEAVTDNVDAYSLYLEARTLFQARARLDYVDQLLERAVQIDPDFSQAWEIRAAVVSLAIEYGFSDLPDEEVARRTEDFAHRALALNPDSSIALAVLAKLANFRSTYFSIHADWANIIDQLAHAVVLDPRNATSLNWYGLALGSAGDLEASLAAFEACIQSEPTYRPCRENQVDALGGLGRDSEALLAFREGLEAGALSPQNVNPALFARTGERDQFLLVTNAPYRLLGWGGHEDLFEALARPDHSDMELAARIREFVASHPDRQPASIAALLTPLTGDAESGLEAGTPLLLYDIHYPQYRASAWFRTWIRETGILAYWQERGFPAICRPAGDNDFECD